MKIKKNLEPLASGLSAALVILADKNIEASTTVIAKPFNNLNILPPVLCYLRKLCFKSNGNKY